MDPLTPDQRHKVMQRIRSKDTPLELRLRKALWHKGIRYRKNYKKLPGSPDIAITKHQIAIFCDSAFWHGKDIDTKKPVQVHADFWRSKIQRNIERDSQVDRQLKSMGWTVLHFWDDEINKHLDDCVAAIIDAIDDASIKTNQSDNYASLDNWTNYMYNGHDDS